jgi:23S rRNA (guanine745-N1)-methyltransferase
VLDHVLNLLRCPHCGAGLERVDAVLCCPAAHSFDVARQGYVNLAGGGAGAASGDDAAMVAARVAFLDAGHFDPLSTALAAECAPAPAGGRGAVVDVGAGPGRHLARVLDTMDGAVGLALDSSAPALRRAARAHPRIGAVGCDAWQALPVRDGVAGVVLSVFAPRNGLELARVLVPGGVLVVVTPEPGHLRELVAGLGLLSVDARKQERLDEQLGPHFETVREERLEFGLRLSRAEAETLVAMGPSARHRATESVRAALAARPEPLEVSAAVRVSVRRRRTSRCP